MKSNFEKKFQELTTEMVEVAFEFVNFDNINISKIFLYGSLEDETLYYNVFYKVNSKISYKENINNFSKTQFDLSDEKIFSLLKNGNELLEEIYSLFEDNKRELPTLIKMIFDTEIEELNIDISYELQYSNHPDWTNNHAFKRWFEEQILQTNTPS